MLWDHQQQDELGEWDVFVEDSRGLWMEGRLLSDLCLARPAQMVCRSGPNESGAAELAPMASITCLKSIWSK
jgi:hypothetical protein